MIFPFYHHAKKRENVIDTVEGYFKKRLHYNGSIII